MFNRRISTRDASPLGAGGPCDNVQMLLSHLERFAHAGQNDAALHHGISALATPSLTARYAAANPITRRRFDTVLRETERAAGAGAAILMGRDGKRDAATIAAARFLGKNVAESLRKLENLLTPRAG